MPNRVIKESIWTSPNLNRLSDLAERHFFRILVLPDDFGCCEVTPPVVKGRCYPLKPLIAEQDIEAWQQELEDNGLIMRWVNGGRQYAYFPTFSDHQRIRAVHQRKTPCPPEDVVSKADDACRQVPSSDRLNPNPNPNPYNTSKEVRQKKPSTQKEPVISEIFTEIKNFLGHELGGNGKDPIPNYGKEGKAIKRMITRGFGKDEILNCWKGKVSQRGGSFVSMVYVNEDIGKTPSRQAPKRTELSTEEEIAESIRGLE